MGATNDYRYVGVNVPIIYSRYVDVTSTSTYSSVYETTWYGGEVVICFGAVSIKPEQFEQLFVGTITHINGDNIGINIYRVNSTVTGALRMTPAYRRVFIVKPS